MFRRIYTVGKIILISSMFVCMNMAMIAGASVVPIEKKIIVEKYRQIDKTARQEGEHTYIPLSVIREVSPFVMKETEDKKIMVRVPRMRPRGDALVIDNLHPGTYIPLPTTSVDGQLYVEAQHAQEGIGLQTIHTEKEVFMEPIRRYISQKEAKPILEKISLRFDPFPTNGEPYSDAEVLPGTYTVVAPSCFQLTKNGVEITHPLSISYVNQYRKQGIAVWPLITNQFSPSITHELLTQRAKWENVAAVLAAYAMIYGLEGYNFDFENIEYSDRAALTEFIAYLSQELKAHGLYISMDITPISDSERWSKVYDRYRLAPHVDYFVLMAYDQTPAGSRIPGPVASYPWVLESVAATVKIIPANKILLGVPFYMREWQELTPGSWKAKTLPIAVNQMRQLQGEETRQWDDNNKLYYSCGIREGVPYQIWHEDIRSLQHKLELIGRFQLAGFAVWRKGFEDSELWKDICSSQTELYRGNAYNLSPAFSK